MTGAHLHLLLTHIPVVGSLIGLVVMAVAWVTRKTDVTQVGLWIFFFSGLAAVGVYLTGESAEEAVDVLPDVSHAIIERHEEVAVVALFAALLLGAVSLIGLLLPRKGLPRWASGAVLILAIIVSGIMAWTANLGGQISHPEIRSGAPVFSSDTNVDGDGTEAEARREDDVDDE